MSTPRAGKVRNRAIAALLLLALGCTGPAIPAHAASVRVVGASRATGCAEEDNVHVPLYGDRVAGLRIEATHPAYVPDLRIDRTAPDFSNCDMRDDPAL